MAEGRQDGEAAGPVRQLGFFGNSVRHGSTVCQGDGHLNRGMGAGSDWPIWGMAVPPPTRSVISRRLLGGRRLDALAGTPKQTDRRLP